MVQAKADSVTTLIFGSIAYRVLMPDKAGVTLLGDYLHGRDKAAVVYEAFTTALVKLQEAHGENMTEWPYAIGTIDFGDIGSVPDRSVGTYCIAAEMTTPIRAVSVLPPGQSQWKASPHYGDQLGLFRDWDYKKIQHQPDDFKREESAAE